MLRAIGEVYRKELEALGFKTAWSDMPPERGTPPIATDEPLLH